MKEISNELLKDYKKNITKIYAFLEPILKAGWTEQEVFNLLIFMETNSDKIKNKNLEQIIALYKKYKAKKY